MRAAAVLLVLLLSACAGYHSAPSSGELSALPPPTASGGDYMRDGFYDGGVNDPDLNARAMWLPE